MSALAVQQLFIGQKTEWLVALLKKCFVLETLDTYLDNPENRHFQYIDYCFQKTVIHH